MIKPILDNVIVQPKQKAEGAETSSGIILPEAQDEASRLRIVVAVGPNVPPDVKVGDTVLMVNQTYKEEFKGFQIVKYEHIIGVIEENEKA